MDENKLMETKVNLPKIEGLKEVLDDFNKIANVHPQRMSKFQVQTFLFENKEHPIPESKYFQSISEVKVRLENLEEIRYKIKMKELDIAELELDLQAIKETRTHEGRKEIQIQRVELQIMKLEKEINVLTNNYKNKAEETLLVYEVYKQSEKESQTTNYEEAIEKIWKARTISRYIHDDDRIPNFDTKTDYELKQLGEQIKKSIAEGNGKIEVDMNKLLITKEEKMLDDKSEKK